MSDLLKKAEQFYAVAAELKRDAEFSLRCADMLERHADSLCELNMKNVPAEDKMANSEGESHG
jgi:hypothetical protein